MGLFDWLFSSSEVLGIAEETLEFVLEASEDAHPNEYMALLRATEASRLGLERDGLVVTDVLFIPGTTSSPVSATVRENQVPNDRTAVGSVHSHPNGVLRPSDQDLRSFTKGSVHVIVGAPYERGDWRAFDETGERRDLPVIDVELPDAEEFFHFDQADLDGAAGGRVDVEADDADADGTRRAGR